LTKNKSWQDINKVTSLNMDQNSQGLPKLPTLKQNSSEKDVEHFKKRLSDLKKLQ